MTPAALAAAAAAFDLLCSGTTTIGTLGHSGEESTKPFSETYRVDLGSKRWCFGGCTETHPIYEVTPERIVFERDERGELNDTLSFVSRENGAFFWRYRGGFVGTDVYVIVQQGKCERRPFSRFPARKF